MTINEAARLLRERDNFLILTHTRPDGDTMGSAAALCHVLQGIGKTAYLFANPQFTDFMPWITAPYLAPQGYEGAFVLAVDTASDRLLPKGFTGKVDLCIDHHPSNTGYATETVLDSAKASCGEVVMEIIRLLVSSFEPAVADLLYIAISTDTGCFAYGNTTGETLAAAAELVKSGARNAQLNKMFFRTSTKARIALEGMIFSSMKYYHEGKTAIAFLSLEMFQKSGATENDCADIASLPGRVEGVITSVLLKETERGHCKASVRSNGIVNACRVCEKFGGGGHAMASGCEINAAPDEAAALIEKAISEEMQ